MCRYGKFAVLDLLDIEDIWPAVVTKFDTVQKNLLPDLMSKALLKDEKYVFIYDYYQYKYLSTNIYIPSLVESVF